jgi:hypothetical protein
VDITTYLFNGNKVDTSKCLVKAVLAEEAKLSASTTLAVGGSGTLTINWSTNSNISSSDILFLTYPNTVTLGTNRTAIKINTGNPITINLTNTTSSSSFTTVSYNLSSIISGLNSSVTIGLVLLNFVFLGDTSPHTIQISVQRNNSLVETGSISISPLPGSLTNVTITPNTTIVS